jgi:hypothetical protein
VALDGRVHQLSSHLFARLVRSGQYPKITSIDSLSHAIDADRKQARSVQAAATALRNMETVDKNMDSSIAITVLDLALEMDDWDIAAGLFAKIKQQGERSLVSSASFLMAKYHFDRGQWTNTVSTITPSRSDLSTEDYHHALLMRGISLQHLRKHRQALAEYAKIPKDSHYYVAARLNMAVANIRQDSWTDAYVIINALLDDKTMNTNDVVTDRLYTVLGYSLLQQQYFRNSRDAFRNVGIDGPYSNKALLGIALSAAYQDDYIGALNAARLLKNKNTHDLPVDEANLLVPFFYEKLQQHATAIAGYTAAVTYFERRLADIEKAAALDDASLQKALESSHFRVALIGEEIIDWDGALPRFFFHNMRLLSAFAPYVRQAGDAALAREYDAVQHEHLRILRDATRDILQQKASHLTHYMNQSRYGFARLQDTIQPSQP